MRTRPAAAVLAACLVAAGCGAEESFTPTDADHDPTTRIPGVLSIDYPDIQHVAREQRVAYKHLPPLGGSHDSFWAACDGVVYPRAVRTENMVHSLEHGAVWIAYAPDKVAGDDLAALTARVEGQPYTMLSPFPGMAARVSVQSWGRQLQVDAVDDPRIDHFITATRGNPYLTPEPGASCGNIGDERFDENAAPPFDPSPPGPDAKPDDKPSSN
ncbi:DUF3105 domain-containing protein [Actinokineospora bangkokensis]|uniref:DUF3105 domain-containing protein n=1 Tax=Actinokineospora bangkokensis TaxID=1193682 RepID=A0A1Q9LGS6_9PSEU|nr:DUF3105 domain-containing protein [Actinokineospora bangkokensis]OLR91251.1 hypothetical protein BJP25_26640 [Actinokineospora bangkokensis]